MIRSNNIKNAQEKIKTFESYHDVEWIRINLEPTVVVLVTLTNKLIWKFTNFLATQVLEFLQLVNLIFSNFIYLLTNSIR